MVKGSKGEPESSMDVGRRVTFITDVAAEISELICGLDRLALYRRWGGRWFEAAQFWILVLAQDVCRPIVPASSSNFWSLVGHTLGSLTSRAASASSMSVKDVSPASMPRSA